MENFCAVSYIVPLINVDGYEFTRKKGGDRLWRKNRQQNVVLGLCQGVDLNRNFSIGYGLGDSSINPCSITYRGQSSLSEPETIAISKAILERKNDIKMYLTFHSHAQYIMFPWSYTKERAEDYDDMKKLAEVGRVALEKIHGTHYEVGTAPELTKYEGAGSSDDWAKGAAKIKYSYTFELRDNGTHKFLLPPDQIRPCGEETFNAVKAMAMQLSAELKKNELEP